MAASFIEYKQKGYWIPDGFIALVARYIEVEIRNDVNCPKWIKFSAIHLKEVALEHCPGWASLNLDKNLTTEKRKNEYIKVLNMTISSLKKKGPLITLSELQNQADKEFSTKWTQGILTDNLIAIIIRIIKLIEGKDGYNVKDNVYLTVIDPPSLNN